MAHPHNNTIGEKIRMYRKRSGMSQLDLELEINASPGFISRIESGKVNPTKETLYKLTKALEVNSIETTYLFDLPADDIPTIFGEIYKYFDLEDLDIVLQEVANLLASRLDFLGIATFQVMGDKIYARTYSKLWYSRFIDKIISMPFNELNISIKDQPNHLIVKTILTKEAYRSNQLSDFTSPPLSHHKSEIISKRVGFKSGIIYPLLYKDTVYGSILYARTVNDDYSQLTSLLTTINNFVAMYMGKE